MEPEPWVFRKASEMTERQIRIAVFGAGGHGKVVVDAIEHHPSMLLACVVDDDPQSVGGLVLGHPVVGGRDALLSARAEVDGVIIAIGNNRTRLKVGGWLAGQGFPLSTLVHPSATVAPSATLGAGTQVMPGAVVNADARIGDNVIVNSGAIVEHDCTVGDGAHVAPRAVLCGGASVGDATLIGAGAVVLPGVKIGRGLLIKAGNIVSKDMVSAE